MSRATRSLTAFPLAAALALGAYANASSDEQSNTASARLAGRQAPTGRTITLTAAPLSPRDDKQIDVKPRGISVGDRSLGAQTLRDGKRPVGRLVGECVQLDARYAGQQCVLTLILRDGLITTQEAGLNRKLPGASLPTDEGGDRSAITGGTGAYAGASGTLTIKPRRKGDTLTIALTP